MVDTGHWFSLDDRPAHQREFSAVARCIDDAECGKWRFAVVVRLDVATACQQQPVDPFVLYA
jgi:hypothetical protein